MKICYERDLKKIKSIIDLKKSYDYGLLISQFPPAYTMT